VGLDICLPAQNKMNVYEMRKQITFQVGPSVVCFRLQIPGSIAAPPHTQWMVKLHTVFLLCWSSSRVSKSMAVFCILFSKTVPFINIYFVLCLYRLFSFINFTICDLFFPVLFTEVFQTTATE